MFNPLDDSLAQKVILLMTGVPGTVAMRDEVSRLIKAGDPNELSAFIDKVMDIKAPGKIGDAAVQYVLDSGFSINDLTPQKIDQITADSLRQGIDSWTGLFSYAMDKVDNNVGKVLGNRAEAADVFTGIVDELDVDVNVNHPLVQEWIDKIDASDESLSEAKNTVKDLIDELTTLPVLVDSNPSDDSTAIAAGQDIVLTFNKRVTAGSGDILIVGSDGDTRTIAVTDSSQVTITGKTLKLNPTEDLHKGTDYSVQLASGVIMDRVDHAFAGISDATTLNFRTINTIPPNSNPTTSEVTLASIAEDSGVRVITQAELLSSASDADGDILTATDLAKVSGNGSLVDNLDDTWSYTPALNDAAEVSFNYSIRDGRGGTANGSASLDIIPVNDNPDPGPSVTLAPIAEDSGSRLITQAELLGSATDVDGDILTATGLIKASGSGSLVDNLDGTWSYTPALNDDTEVRFNFTIDDGNGGTATGNASLDITSLNDNPITSKVTLAPIDEDSGSRLITQAELLGSATDVDGDILTATGLIKASGSGSLVDNLDGTWSYTPDLQDDTEVNFSYTINDGNGGTVAGGASLDILPVVILLGGDTVFVIDRSGSTISLAQGLTTLVGDQNGDGFSNTIFDVEIASFIALNQSLISRGLGDVAKVSTVQFGSIAGRLDMEPGTAGVQSFTTPLTDSDKNGIIDVNQVLASISVGYNTNFEAALKEAIISVNAAGTAPGQGNVIFLSDGFPNAGGIYTDEANFISSTLGQNLRAFGIGTGASLTALQAIDPSAEVFINPQDILDIFLF